MNLKRRSVPLSVVEISESTKKHKMASGGQDGEDANKKNGKKSYLRDGSEEESGSTAASPRKEARFDSESSQSNRQASSSNTEDDVGANPFAMLRLDSKKGEQGMTFQPETTTDADSGIENFEAEDVQMESPAKSAADPSENLKRILTRILHLGRNEGLQITQVSDLFDTLTEEIVEDSDEIDNFLQNILMEIMFYMMSEEGSRAWIEFNSAPSSGDSLSCSPSRESSFAVSTMFLRQHSAVFNDLACAEGTKELQLFNYILGCYNRLRAEEVNETLTPSVKKVLNQLWLQLLSHCTMILRGYFNGEETDACNVLLLRALLNQTLPPSFVEDLVKYSDSEPEIFEAICQPVMKGIIRAGNVSTLINDDYRQPLQLLKDLLDIKFPGTNRRPFCSLLVKRNDWIPQQVTKAMGREISKLSFLGPFFSLSIFPQDGWISVANHYFPDGITDETASYSFQNVRQLVGSLRGDLHKVLHAILVNSESRSAAIEFIVNVLKRNEKRAQMQVDPSMVATDGFMLNFLSVMYELASKIDIGKVNTFYPFHPDFPLDISEQARLRMDQKEAETFKDGLTKEVEFDVKFPTQCFFLTMHAQRLALNPALNKHTSLLRDIAHWKRQLKKLEDTKDLWDNSLADPVTRQRNSRKIQSIQKVMLQMNKSKYCGEALMLDEGFLSRALAFTSKQLALLTSTVLSGNKESLPQEATELFKAYPEFYLEDALDFLLTVQKNHMELLVNNVPYELPLQILVFVCSTNYIKSPFLAAKAVEILFMTTVQPATRNLYESIMHQAINKPFTNETLFLSLMKFYVDVELTGSHTEFFDKFTFRYHVQVIFKMMWTSGIHRSIMMELGRQCGPDFVKFISMVINDTTFLLDESLEALKKINEFEILVKDPRFAAMTQEEQQSQRELYEQNRSMARSYLQLTNETLHLFGYMTQDLPQPFLNPLLGERLAAMLNYNMVQLCGPECQNLKVENRARYGWKPRELLQQLAEIYLHLDSPEFATHIAADERSYSQDMFAGLVNRLSRSRILGQTQVEKIKGLGDRAFELWKENAQMEEDWGEIPDEFADPIMGTLMRDPVRLPTGHVMDRKVIQRHLLSAGPQNPFSREHLTEDELVQEVDLKKKVTAWVKEKMQERSLPKESKSEVPLD